MSLLFLRLVLFCSPSFSRSERAQRMRLGSNTITTQEDSRNTLTQEALADSMDSGPPLSMLSSPISVSNSHYFRYTSSDSLQAPNSLV
jgi:hypothetical protein